MFPNTPVYKGTISDKLSFVTPELFQDRYKILTGNSSLPRHLNFIPVQIKGNVCCCVHENIESHHAELPTHTQHNRLETPAFWSYLQHKLA